MDGRYFYKAGRGHYFFPTSTSTWSSACSFTVLWYLKGKALAAYLPNSLTALAKAL
jgi:hypothetical protein